MENIKEKKQWIDYKGTNICYQSYKHPLNSNKPYIIFIHGFLSSQYSFRKMVPLLIDKFNLITIDLPPFGDSDRITKFTYSYSNLANIIVYFMNTKSIPSAYLVGHSMGGQIALTCAYHYPDRIKKLILLAPCSYLSKADRFSYLISWLPFFPTLIKRLLYRKGVFETLRQCVYNESVITKDMLTTYIKPFLDNAIYLCLTKMVRDREGDLDMKCLATIQTETFIFWGKKDEILPVSIGYKLVQDLPAAELCTFDYAGHLLPEEVPNIICDRILAHCN
ncbi:alpha/beta fold hydrolase [Aquibacillus saliphilus]|uniref:alpha/beta fold hydrolase n=1 Tax=Aquibacillus saliphilus TaxID=1909422 RepID=UPI001CF00342|nr:alpha/beta hydrolase [Aquibacillus saliphilus]